MSMRITKSEFDLTQILNGVAIIVPSPFGYHQRVSMRLSFLIQLYLNENRSIFHPEAHIHGVPDLLIMLS